MVPGMFEQFFYLFGILGAIGGLAVLDYRFNLVMALDAVRAIRVMSIGYSVFLVWDILGVKLNIFFVGSSRFMTHLQLFKNFMFEELFFIVLLVYLPLILWQGLKHLNNKSGNQYV